MASNSKRYRSLRAALWRAYDDGGFVLEFGVRDLLWTDEYATAEDLVTQHFGRTVARKLLVSSTDGYLSLPELHAADLTRLPHLKRRAKDDRIVVCGSPSDVKVGRLLAQSRGIPVYVEVARIGATVRGKATAYLTDDSRRRVILARLVPRPRDN